MAFLKRNLLFFLISLPVLLNKSDILSIATLKWLELTICSSAPRMNLLIWQRQVNEHKPLTEQKTISLRPLRHRGRMAWIAGHQVRGEVVKPSS